MIKNQSASAPLTGNLRFNQFVREAMKKTETERRDRPLENIQTIRSILWKKFVRTVEHSDLGRVCYFIGMFSLSIFIGLSFTYSDQSKLIFTQLMELENYLIPKLALSGLLVNCIPFFFRTFSGAFREFKHKMKLNRRYEIILDDTEEVEGIEVEELIDHLIEEGTFKRDEIETIFGLSRNRFTRLAKRLDGLGIIERGENNSRVFNYKHNRQELYDLLTNTSPSPLPVFYSNEIPHTI